MNTGLLRTPSDATPTGFDRFWPGRYVQGSPMLGGTVTTLTTTDDRLMCQPLLLDVPVTFDRMAVSVSTAGGAGSLIRLGLYASRDSDMAPGTLTTDYGTLASDSTGFKETFLSPALTLEPGLWWPAFVSQSVGAAPVVRAVVGWTPWLGNSTSSGNTSSCYEVGVSGPLPRQFGLDLANTQSESVRTYLRVAP